MKKMIVSLMLIISMFAFAAESAPSATVGYVKFTNTFSATLTDVNHITLPLTNGWTSSNLIDPTATNINSVAKWYPATQTYKTSSRVGTIWTNTFKTYPGDLLVVNAKQAHDMIVAGTLNTLPPDTFYVNATLSDVFHYMHRLTKTSITSSTLLGNDIGTINSIARWNNVTQTFKTSSKVGTIWTNAFTDLAITQPLILNSTGDKIYSDAKGDGENTAEEATYVPKAGLPRAVYIGVTDASNNAYDFSAAPYGTVTFTAYIKERPDEIINEINALANGIGGYETFDAGASSIWFDISYFTTAWSAGDSLFVRIKDENGNAKLANEEWWKCQLDSDASPIVVGLDTWLGAGVSNWAPANAIMINSPSSIEGSNVPVTTALHQNYPNPFNPVTTIKFDLAENSNVKLNVYNYNGQLVRSLVNGTMNAGYHSVNFDAANLAAGVYYYTMETAGKTMTQKMVLVK